MRRSHLCLTTAMTSLLGLHGFALAQTTDQSQQPAASHIKPSPPLKPGTVSQSGLETINVTAQRRSQRLQDVPIAVTAVSPKELETYQIHSTTQVAELVPNMSGLNNPGLGSAAAYYIRGLGSTSTLATFDPAVGTYVDDIYIPRQNATDFGFFDIDQLQVLRGPQGTLFGSNTTGGAVVVNLRVPGQSFGGYGEIGYGEYQSVTSRGSIDSPLSDKIFTKTSYFAQTDDGWAKDIVTHQRINQTHDVGVREAVRVLVNDDTTWDLSGSYIRDDVLFLPTQVIGGQRISVSGLSLSGGALSPYITGHIGNNGQVGLTQSWLAASHVTVIKDYGRFDFITGYQGIAQNNAEDLFDASYSTGGYVTDNFDRNSTVSQELKYTNHLGSRLTYTAGLYYSRESDMTNYAGLSTGTIGYHPPGTKGAPFLIDDGTLNNTTESYAAYGQADYKITNALTLTLGTRYTIQDKKFNYNSANNPVLGSRYITMGEILAAGIPDSEKTTLPSFHGALSYRFNPDLMAYVSGTEGFKSGGWNAFGDAPAQFTRFGPEKDWTVEAGIRSNFWGNRGRFNLTGFWMYDNGLQTTADTVLSNGTASFLTGNFSDLENYGLEADGALQVVPALTIQGNVGIQHAWYTNLAPGIASQLASCRAGVAASCGESIVTPGGNVAEPEFTPAFNSTLGYQWDVWGNDRFKLTNQADVNLVSRELVALAGIPSSIDKFRAVLDMGLSLQVDTKWTVTAECKNCTFVNYAVYGLGTLPFLNAPGYWDLKLSYKF